MIFFYKTAVSIGLFLKFGFPVQRRIHRSPEFRFQLRENRHDVTVRQVIRNDQNIDITGCMIRAFRNRDVETLLEVCKQQSQYLALSPGEKGASKPRPLFMFRSHIGNYGTLIGYFQEKLSWGNLESLGSGRLPCLPAVALCEGGSLSPAMSLSNGRWRSLAVLGNFWRSGSELWRT